MYRICILLAFILSIVLFCVLVKGSKENKIIHRMLILSWSVLNPLAAYIGAMIVATMLSGFTRYGGLSSLGGLIGFALATVFEIKTFPEYKAKIVDAAFLSMPIIYCIAKIGCYFGGCCGGRLPVQLIESAAFGVIFIISFIRQHNGQSYKFFLMTSTGIAKGGLDFLRYEQSIVVKIVCLVGIIVTVVVWMNTRRSISNEE